MTDLTIKALENGPFVVPGTATYVNTDGQEKKTPGSAVALCRCGGSQNKPFCDGSHTKGSFEAPGIELTLEAQ